MASDPPLAGKVGVITGASSGVGKAAAVSWAAMGADIVASARSDAPRPDGYPSLIDTRREVEATGRRCIAVRTDVASPADIDQLQRTAAEAFGRCDILMNNAAALEPGPMNKSFFDMTLDEWRYQIDVNLTGPWLVTADEAELRREVRALATSIGSFRAP